MNYFKFLYDVFVYITNNYSKMPDDFKARFPESHCVESRLLLSDITDCDSNLNANFCEYE